MIVSKYLDSVDSTQLWAKKHLTEFDLNKMCYVMAATQTQGMGTRGKSWHSPNNQNIYVTYIYKLKNNLCFYINLAQVLSMSIAYVLQNLGLSPTLKWPNDILLSDKKCGGILCEILAESCVALIGLGLNINMDDSQTKQIDIPSTSLFLETQKKFSVTSIFHQITDRFKQDITLYESSGFSPFFHQYKNLMPYIGYDVFIDHTQIGISHAIQQDGLLVVLKNDHTLMTISSGSIHIFS